MKILVFGDIYGRVGRKALAKEIDGLKERHNPDFIIANIDNCSSGRGAIEKHVRELKELGIDLFSGGDHIFDNIKSVEAYLNAPGSDLLRPANFYEQDHYAIPGKGYSVFEKNGKKLLFIHIMGQVFMNYHLYSPFLKVEEILKKLENENITYDASVIDFHCEASAEFYGLAQFLDGKVSGIFGTHTHVQTNDDIILPKGTGIMSDVGMNGPLYGVIGADYGSVRKRFLTGIGKGIIEQSLDKNYCISGLVLDIGEDQKCLAIEKIRIRGTL